MKLNLKRRQSGFTIIEVVIVLAIAATIMVVVFLAVPALQRNSRNNQYRSEAGQLAAAVAEFTNNNGGTVPASSPTDNGPTVVGLTKNAKLKTLTIQASDTKVTVPNPPTTAYYEASSSCGAASSDNTYTPGAGSGGVIIFGTENASGIVAQCIGTQ